MQSGLRHQRCASLSTRGAPRPGTAHAPAQRPVTAGWRGPRPDDARGPEPPLPYPREIPGAPVSHFSRSGCLGPAGPLTRRTRAGVNWANPEAGGRRGGTGDAEAPRPRVLCHRGARIPPRDPRRRLQRLSPPHQARRRIQRLRKPSSTPGAPPSGRSACSTRRPRAGVHAPSSDMLADAFPSEDREMHSRGGPRPSPARGTPLPSC